MQSATIKQLILAILFSASSIGAAFLWHRAAPLIAAGESLGAGSFVPPVLALVAAATLFALHVLFVSRRGLLWFALASGVGAPYFFVPSDGIALGALAASVCLAAFGAWRMRNEATHALQFTFSKIAKFGLHLYLTAFALTVSIFFLNALDEERAIAFFLPRPVLSWALDQASGQLESVGAPPVRFNPEGTVDDFLRSYAAQELLQQGAGAEDVSEDQIRALAEQARADLAARYGISFRGDERASDVLHRVVAERIRDALGPYQTYLPVASGIAFFFAFKAFTYPLYFLALGAGFLLIKLLRAGSILVVEKRTIEVERLAL